MAQSIATREGYGETLVELVKEGHDIMAVEADLSGSTTTKKLQDYDSSRLVNVGIAEQNMIGVAAGLSLAGKTVFTGSFAAFGTGRCILSCIKNCFLLSQTPMEALMIFSKTPLCGRSRKRYRESRSIHFATRITFCILSCMHSNISFTADSGSVRYVISSFMRVYMEKR